MGYTPGMKTAISIDDRTFAEAEQVAKELDMSRSEFYVDSVRRRLREIEDAKITAKLNEVYGPMGGEDPETAEFRREAVRRAVERNEW